MTTCCGPQCSWQNLGGRTQHRELPCQALGEVRSSFNFVISSAACKHILPSMVQRPQDTTGLRRTPLYPGALMSNGCLRLLGVFDAASALLPLESTHTLFDVRLRYFKDTAEAPSLPLAELHGISYPSRCKF